MGGGVRRLLFKGKKAHLDGLSAFEQHSPYTHEQCVTQWCCQRNQTPFLLHWRRSKSYRHRPRGCPWVGSPVCRQSRQRPGLKETEREQYCQPRVCEIQASRDRRPYSLWHQHTKWKVLFHLGHIRKHFHLHTVILMVSISRVLRKHIWQFW